MRQLKLSAYFSRLFVLLSLAVLAACGEGDSIRSPDIPGAELQSIQVTCTPAILSVGEVGQCTAQGKICRIVEEGDDNFVRKCPLETISVNWRSDNPDVVAIDENGETTGIAPGETEIVGTLDGISGRAPIRVPEGVLQEITVDCPDEVIVGQTEQCTAEGLFVDENGTEFPGVDITNVVDWESDDADVSVNDSGEITGVSANPNPDTVTITATSGDIFDTDTVVVRTLDVVSLDVTPDAGSILPLCTLQYTATATFEDNSTQNVTLDDATVWSSSSSDTTVNSDGLVTGGPNGTPQATITATFTDEAGNEVTDGATADIVDVDVLDQAGGGLCVEALENATDTFACNVDDQFNKPVGIDVPFVAKLRYDDMESVCPLLPEDPRLTWSSTDETVATVNDSGVAHTEDVGSTDIVADFDSGTGILLQGEHPLFVGGDVLVDYHVLPGFSCVGFYDAAGGLQDSEDLPGGQQMRAEGQFQVSGWTCDGDGDGDFTDHDFTNNPSACTGALTNASSWTLIRGFWDESAHECVRSNDEIPDEDVPGGLFMPERALQIGVNCIQGVPDANTGLVGGGTVVVLPATNDILVAQSAELCEALGPLLTVGDNALLPVVAALTDVLDQALLAVDDGIGVTNILNMVLATASDELTSQLIGEGAPLEALITALDDTYGTVNCVLGDLLNGLLGGGFQCPQ